MANKFCCKYGLARDLQTSLDISLVIAASRRISIWHIVVESCCPFLSLVVAESLRHRTLFLLVTIVSLILDIADEPCWPWNLHAIHEPHRSVISMAMLVPRQIWILLAVDQLGWPRILQVVVIPVGCLILLVEVEPCHRLIWFQSLKQTDMNIINGMNLWNHILTIRYEKSFVSAPLQINIHYESAAQLAVKRVPERNMYRRKQRF